MHKLIELAAIFFKVGLFTFGGGYAMLPMLQAEVVNKRRFLTEEQLLDLYSIGQCTPGIIAVNVATFIGYRQRGLWGAIFATLGMVLPSLIIISLIAAVLGYYMHNRWVSYAFAGVRIGVAALVADVIFGLWAKNIKNISAAVVFGGALVLAALKVSAVWIVLAAALWALLWGEFGRRHQ